MSYRLPMFDPLPWQTVERKQQGKKGAGKGKGRQLTMTQDEARILAHVRSAMHAGTTKDQKVNQWWAHRKAEWICPCGQYNIVDRSICRACSKPWASTMVLVPAGSPPPGKQGSRPPPPPSTETVTMAGANKDDKQTSMPWHKPPPKPTDQTNLSPEERAVTAAEQALSAAKAAALPKHIIDPMEVEVREKRKTMETALGKKLPKRFSEATQQEKEASEQLAKAERALTQAQETLEAARSHHKKTAAELAAVKAEIAAADAAQKEVEPSDADPKLATDLAAAQQVQTTLDGIIQAYKAACVSDDGQEARKKALETTLQEAFTASLAKEEAARVEAEKATKADAAAKAMAVDGEERKRKGDEGLEATQPGEDDLNEDDLEALLRQVPASKRQRAAQRLTQLGVADGTDLG